MDEDQGERREVGELCVLTAANSSCTDYGYYGIVRTLYIQSYYYGCRPNFNYLVRYLWANPISATILFIVVTAILSPTVYLPQCTTIFLPLTRTIV